MDFYEFEVSMVLDQPELHNDTLSKIYAYIKYILYICFIYTVIYLFKLENNIIKITSRIQIANEYLVLSVNHIQMNILKCCLVPGKIFKVNKAAGTN